MLDAIQVHLKKTLDIWIGVWYNARSLNDTNTRGVS